jgi:hypothetical protein
LHYFGEKNEKEIDHRKHHILHEYQSEMFLMVLGAATVSCVVAGKKLMIFFVLCVRYSFGILVSLFNPEHILFMLSAMYIVIYVATSTPKL